MNLQKTLNSKKIAITIALIANIANTTTTKAQDFTIDGVNYNITNTDVANRTVEIAASSCFIGDLDLTTPIVNAGNTYTITNIVPVAFLSCLALTSITLPNSITRIRGEAFAGCSNLTSVTLPNALTSIESQVFSSCSSLESIDFPSTIVSIENDAFSSCTTLTSITLPDALTSIGNQAFINCNKLTNIIFSETNLLTSTGEGAFKDCSSLESITLPNGITSVNASAFEDCENLRNVSFPSSLVAVAGSAFRDCGNLEILSFHGTTAPIVDVNAFKNVPIADVVLKVPGGAGGNSYQRGFWNTFLVRGIVSSFTMDGILFSIIDSEANYVQVGAGSCPSGVGGNVVLSNPITIDGTDYTITNIEESAFRDCTELVSIVLPNTLTHIQNFAFNGCTSLNSITLNTLNAPVADGMIIADLDRNDITLKVPVNRLVYYRGNPFWGNFGTVIPIIDFSEDGIHYSITSNISPYTVQIAANSCYSESRPDLLVATTVSYDAIDYTITTLAENAFKNCTTMVSIVIPSSITAIGMFAFSGCTALRDFTNNIPTPLVIDANVFTGVDLDSATLRVSSSSQMAYNAAAVWMDFSTQSVIGNFVIAGVNYSITDRVARTLEITEDSCYSAVGGNMVLGEVTFNSINYTVTTIAAAAFMDCVELVSIALPSTIESIGENAFNGCTALNDFSINKATPLVIDANVFTNIADATTLRVPVNNVAAYETALVWQDFDIKLAIVDFTIAGVNYSVTDAVANTVQIAINSCYSENGGVLVLNSVTPSNGVTYDITTIAAAAFMDCVELVSIALPSTIESIGENAFNGCTALNDFSINKAMPLVIDANVFTGIADITTLRVPVNNVATYATAFVWEDFDTKLAIVDFTIAGVNYSVTDAVANTVQIAVNSCYSENGGVLVLNSVTPSNGVTYDITTFEEAAFMNCEELTNITLPSTVVSISDNVFNGCTGLTDFTINKAVPLDINATVFTGVDLGNATLRVPSGSLEAYSMANIWMDFNRKEETLNVGTPIKKEGFKIAINNNRLEILTANSLKIHAIQMINLRGQVVKTRNESSITIVGLPVGVYIVFIKTNKGNFSKKMVIY